MSEKVEVFLFDSYSEMVDEVMAISHQINNLTSQRKFVPGKPGYELAYVGRMFNSWNEVKRATESAWDEGLDALQDMRRQLLDVPMPKPKSIRRRSRWSEDDGDEIDLDRLRRGSPFWRDTHRPHRPGPQNATIITDTTAAWFQNSHDILWRGAASIILTEMLEAAGYRVELWAAHAGAGWSVDEYDYMQAVCLKRPQAMIDSSSIVNSLSGWSYRTIWFGASWLRNQPPTGNTGYCSALTEWMVKQITPDENVTECKDIWDMDSSVEWIKQTLSKFDLEEVKND